MLADYDYLLADHRQPLAAVIEQVAEQVLVLTGAAAETAQEVAAQLPQAAEAAAAQLPQAANEFATEVLASFTGPTAS